MSQRDIPDIGCYTLIAIIAVTFIICETIIILSGHKA